MAKDNGSKGDEVPPRTYGVHWPSNPAPDATGPETTSPTASPRQESETKQAAPAPAAQTPAKKPAAAPAGPPPPPVIPPLPPTAAASAQPAKSSAPVGEMPSAPPRVAPAAMPATPPPVVVPKVEIPQVVEPEPVAPQAVAPQPIAPQPVEPQAVTPEPVYVPQPADLLIPVPSGTPGLPIDPLTSPEIPVLPPVAAPDDAFVSDTSGLSRREMRKLREQATARIGESSDSLSRIEEAAAMAAAPQAVQSPYVATGQPASLVPAQPSQVVQPGYAAQQVQPVQYAPAAPLSTTLPGIPAAAVEMAAITGRLDIIEATQTPVAPTQTPVAPTQTPVAPTLSSGPTVAQLRAMEEASRAGMARDVVLESTVPGLSTTGGVPTSGHSLIVSNVPTDVPSALSAMNETGEIIVTGQIILPASVAQTGTDMRRFDTAEIDVVAEREPQTGNVGNLAPVSATRAVSAFSSHSTSSLPPRVGSHRLPMVLALIAAGLAIGVVGLFVANIFLKFF